VPGLKVRELGCPSRYRKRFDESLNGKENRKAVKNHKSSIFTDEDLRRKATVVAKRKKDNNGRVDGKARGLLCW